MTLPLTRPDEHFHDKDRRVVYRVNRIQIRARSWKGKPAGFGVSGWLESVSAKDAKNDEFKNWEGVNPDDDAEKSFRFFIEKLLPLGDKISQDEYRRLSAEYLLECRVSVKRG